MMLLHGLKALRHEASRVHIRPEVGVQPDNDREVGLNPDLHAHCIMRRGRAGFARTAQCSI
jgi:hypothetical protein